MNIFKCGDFERKTIVLTIRSENETDRVDIYWGYQRQIIDPSFGKKYFVVHNISMRIVHVFGIDQKHKKIGILIYDFYDAGLYNS